MSENILPNYIQMIPNELWLQILERMDIISISRMICTNRSMCELIENYKWELIDKIIQRRSSLDVSEDMFNIEVLIPLNRETYYNYIYIIDFSSIIYFKRCQIPENVIRSMKELIDMNLLATHQRMSEDLLRIVYNDITVVNLLNYQILPLDILISTVENNTMDNTHWHLICKNQRLDLQFIETYYGKIDWHALSSNCETIYNSPTSHEILKRYADKFVWVELTGRGLTEEVICANFDRINSPFCWYNIAYTSRLSSNFMRKYRKYLDKMVLFSCQEVEESLIIELLEDCNVSSNKNDLWSKIASTQALSTDFIKRYKNNLPLYLLIRNPKVLRNSLKAVFG